MKESKITNSAICILLKESFFFLQMMPSSFKQTESDAKEALDFFGKRGTSKLISSENKIYLEEESPVKKKKRKQAKGICYFLSNLFNKT